MSQLFIKGVGCLNPRCSSIFLGTHCGVSHDMCTYMVCLPIDYVFKDIAHQPIDRSASCAMGEFVVRSRWFSFGTEKRRPMMMSWVAEVKKINGDRYAPPLIMHNFWKEEIQRDPSEVSPVRKDVSNVPKFGTFQTSFQSLGRFTHSEKTFQMSQTSFLIGETSGFNPDSQLASYRSKI